MANSFWVNNSNEFIVDENGDFYFDDFCCCDVNRCCPSSSNVAITLSFGNDICDECNSLNGEVVLGFGFCSSLGYMTNGAICGVGKQIGSSACGNLLANTCLSLYCDDTPFWEAEAEIKVIDTGGQSHIHHWYKSSSGVFSWPLSFGAGDKQSDSASTFPPCNVQDSATFYLV